MLSLLTKEVNITGGLSPSNEISIAFGKIPKEYFFSIFVISLKGITLFDLDPHFLPAKQIKLLERYIQPFLRPFLLIAQKKSKKKKENE